MMVKSLLEIFERLQAEDEVSIALVLLTQAWLKGKPCMTHDENQFMSKQKQKNNVQAKHLQLHQPHHRLLVT